MEGHRRKQRHQHQRGAGVGGGSGGRVQQPTFLQRLGFQPMSDHSHSEAYRIPRIQILFVSSVFLFCIMQIAFASWLLAQNYGTTSSSSSSSGTTPREVSDQRAVILTASHAREFALIVIYAAAALLFFAFDAVWLGSVFEFRDSIATSLILTVYVMYTFFASNLTIVIKNSVEISWAIATGIFQLVFVIGVFFIEKSFMYRAFRQVGANQEMQSMYRTLMVCESLMKLDAVIAFLLMLMSYLFLGGGMSKTAAVSIAAAVFTIAWTVSLFSSIRREDKCLIIAVFACCWIQPAYVIYKLIDLKLNPGHYSADASPRVRGFEEFLFIGVFYVLVRFSLIVYAWSCWGNFGKGLRNKVFLRSAAASIAADVNGEQVAYNSIPQTEATDV
jgi:hypothetical protein